MPNHRHAYPRAAAGTTRLAALLLALLALPAPLPVRGQGNQAAEGPAAQPAGDTTAESAQGQANVAPAAAAVQPKIQIDVPMLIAEPQSLSASVSDPVWRIDAEPGRRLVMIPLRIESAADVLELKPNAVRIRGGRFITWRIPAAEEESPGVAEPGGPLASPGQDFTAAPRPTGRPMPRELGRPMPGGLPGGMMLPGRPPITRPPATPERAPGPSIPLTVNADSTAEPPRLARTVRIRPDGTIAWEVDRGIPGATIAGTTNPYAFKADMKLLAKLTPTRPPRVTRQANEDPRAFRERVQRETAAHRDQVEASRRRRQEISQLPDEFQAPMPSRLWAVYDLPSSVRELAVSGVQPSDWSIALSDLELLQAAAAGGGAVRSPQPGGPAPPEAAAKAEQLGRILRTTAHPYTSRAVAVTLGGSGLAAHMAPGDPMQRMVESLLRSQDTATRELAVQQLLTVTPPTPAVLTLLRLATRDAEGQIRLQALRGVLHGGASSQQELAQLLGEAGRLLVQSPAPRQVLAELLAVDPTQESLRQALIAQIRFDGLSGPRRAEAIAFVIEAAPQYALAAGWLDHQLLGSTDPELVRQTLLILDSASTGGSVIEPLVARLLDRWLGPPAVARSGSKDRLTLSGPVAIGTVNHGLLRALLSGDADTRARAWHALRHFAVSDLGESAPRADGAGGAGPPPADPYSVLVDAALNRTTTPMQAAEAAEFLARQGDEPRSTLGLVRLALSPSTEAAGRAARLLLGSARSIESALDRLPFEARQQFATAMYQACGQVPPLCTALLRHPVENNAAVGWFAGQVAAGSLPKRPEWAAAFGGEDQLLDLVSGGDRTMALAAVAALVFTEGGDDDSARKITEELLGRPDLSRSDLLPEWHRHRHSLRLSRLKEAAGPYRLVVNVYAGSAGAEPGTGARPPAMTPPMPGMGPRPMMPGGPGTLPGPMMMPSQPVQRAAPAAATTMGPLQSTLELGTVTLQVGEDSISFGTDSIALSVPDEHLAIRFANPMDLRNLGNAEVTSLPLDSIGGALDLLPEENRRWRGTATLPDGRVLELLMQPAEAAGPAGSAGDAGPAAQ